MSLAGEALSVEEELAELRGLTLTARDRAIRGFVDLACGLSDMRRAALRGVEITSATPLGQARPTLDGLTDPLGIIATPGDEWRAFIRDAEALAAAAMPRRGEEGTVSISVPLFARNRKKA